MSAGRLRALLPSGCFAVVSLAGELGVALLAERGHALDQVGRRRGERLEMRFELERAREIGFERGVEQSLREAERPGRSRGERARERDGLFEQDLGRFDALVCQT